MSENGHQFAFASVDGEPIPLAEFRGGPILIVNTASGCGFTPQYKELQELWARYRSAGLTVIGVPSNDFRQEPLSNAEIKNFCRAEFGVDFHVTTKERVSGDGAHPFFRWAASVAPEAGIPRWNFHKFLISPFGELAQVYPSVIRPLDKSVVGAVEGMAPTLVRDRLAILRKILEENKTINVSSATLRALFDNDGITDESLEQILRETYTGIIVRDPAAKALKPAADFFGLRIEDVRKALEELAAEVAPAQGADATAPQLRPTTETSIKEITWPTESWLDSPERASRKNFAIIKYLRRVWKPFIDANNVLVTRHTLETRDRNAALALKGYLRAHDMPGDLGIIRDKDLKAYVATHPIAAPQLKND